MSATFNPEFSELLSEAFANCSLRPVNVVQEHIDEAIRSANLALVKFSNAGVTQYNLVYRTLNLVSGTAVYNLGADVLDVWSATIYRDTVETPIWPIGRVDYMNIPKKTHTGRAYNYFVDRGKQGITPRQIYLWPTPDRSTDVINYWAWIRNSDEIDMRQVSPMSYEWLDAYASELSARMAWKFAPDKIQLLEARAAAAFTLARQADRERAPTRFKVRGYLRQRPG